MRAHAANTKEVVAFLETSDQVDQIFLPKVDGVQLTDYGGMLFFRMKDDEAGDKSDAFSSALNLFDRGTPMATVCSAVAIPYTGSHLSMTPDEKLPTVTRPKTRKSLKACTLARSAGR